jgi:UDP-N-acetylglucosamine--N-acetylmuramyl-(pentapeptide) pyrophosphoryl-undecaprenol N-acetylglucosamine transferase
MMPYPVRTNLKKYPKHEARALFGLSPEKKTLFVFGGSQGANSINNAVLGCFRELVSKDIQIIWQTGESYYDNIQNEIKLYKSINAVKYIDNIDFAYSAADLIVCRSGISTIMELASFGAAVIFVPYPLASENHQQKNAMSLVEKGAAEIILDKELSENLYSKITENINDDNKLESMRKNISQFADKDAAKKIAEFLTGLVKTQKN